MRCWRYCRRRFGAAGPRAGVDAGGWFAEEQMNGQCKPAQGVGEEIAMLNVEEIRRQFPALHEEFGGRPAVFFDNPAARRCMRA